MHTLDETAGVNGTACMHLSSASSHCVFESFCAFWIVIEFRLKCFWLRLFDHQLFLFFFFFFSIFSNPNPATLDSMRRQFINNQNHKIVSRSLGSLFSFWIFNSQSYTISGFRTTHANWPNKGHNVKRFIIIIIVPVLNSNKFFE